MSVEDYLSEEAQAIAFFKMRKERAAIHNECMALQIEIESTAKSLSSLGAELLICPSGPTIDQPTLDLSAKGLAAKVEGLRTKLGRRAELDERIASLEGA